MAGYADQVQSIAMDDVASKIAVAVGHIPEWVRHDLASRDRATRLRAEETLAAILSNALVLKAA